MATYLIFKPYGMLSQFSKEVETHITLADLDYDFEKDVYPIGRLDKDTEGLLMLTNKGQLNAQLLSPYTKTKKIYLVQVEGTPTPNEVLPLSRGIKIRINKKEHRCLPAEVKILSNGFSIVERNPPIRQRNSIPTSWLELTITEGKNRQVRRMCAAIGFPVLRLIRIGFANFHLDSLPHLYMNPGAVLQIDEEKILPKRS